MWNDCFTCIIIIIYNFIDCGEPPNVEHGSVTLVDDLHTSYGAGATLVCVQGYNASSATFICDETGYWEAVTCDVIGKILTQDFMVGMSAEKNFYFYLNLILCYYTVKITNGACRKWS